MKISKIINMPPGCSVKKAVGIALAAGSLSLIAPLTMKAQTLEKDTLEIPSATITKDSIPAIARVPAKGTTDSEVLREAPSPVVYIAGKRKKAAIVVDLSNNVLFLYHETGIPLAAYLVASGKKNTPTDKGVRIVTHTESYPYASAPEKTRRRNH